MTPRKKDKKQFPDDYPPFNYDWENLGGEMPEVDKPKASRYGRFLLFLAAGGAVIIVAVINNAFDLIGKLIDRQSSTPTPTSSPAPSFTVSPKSDPTDTPTAFLPTDTLTPLPPTATSSPSFTPPPPVDDEPALSITSPPDAVMIACPMGLACQFDVSGTSSAIVGNPDLVIWTLVHPDQPIGQGWYLQRTAVLKSRGDWEQPANFLGETGRVHGGDTFTVVAIAAAVDATYQGISLYELPPSSAILELRLVEGLVAQSDPVTISVLMETLAAP